MNRRVQAVLFISHFLVLTKLYRAGGIHTGADVSFVGLRMPELLLPAFSIQTVHSAIFMAGLLCAWAFVKVCKCGPSQKTTAILAALMAFEIYFVALDLRLQSRSWELLMFLSMVSFTRSVDWLRFAFLAIPFSSPWPVLGLLFSPLYHPRLAHRQKLLWALAFLLVWQGHWAIDIDLSILSLLMLWAVHSESDPDLRLGRTAAGAAICSLLMATVLYDGSPDLSYLVNFQDHQGTSHRLEVLRNQGRVTVLADGKTVDSGWNIDGKLYLNLYYFSAHPETLESDVLFRHYGEELARRNSAGHYQFRRQTPAPTAPTGQGDASRIRNLENGLE